MGEEMEVVENVTTREKQLIQFIRELGWGELRIRVENGQPVLIYEAVRIMKLEEKSVSLYPRRKK
ncbi:MAG: hypothetical protein IMW93_00495 [Thermoanaerobacteraceae bacterium]|uniref:DUF2292 domain-containing protein n=1 Tax=Desulfofundulus thermobenzoicus TaxID=29376 RepID=A0A6N7IMI9_9FIRM|nr:hypothetical protein [Desulfofundulus thermobenzoicus]MBE3587034.1 hypothetical protein [Thermoanaerobacteraceae bacterium]MQL51134.1 hypothetical protein [Desulfofundulus thermobenzoicus]